MFGSPPAARNEQARLEAELQENERQLETVGDTQSALAMELECLRDVLANPERHLRVGQRQLRLNTMNVVLEEGSTERAAEVDFSVAELAGPPRQRAFMVARVARAELPATQGIDFDDAARYL